VYPPSAATRDQYRAWVAAGRPRINDVQTNDIRTHDARMHDTRTEHTP